MSDFVFSEPKVTRYPAEEGEMVRVEIRVTRGSTDEPIATLLSHFKDTDRLLRDDALADFGKWQIHENLKRLADETADWSRVDSPFRS